MLWSDWSASGLNYTIWVLNSYAYTIRSKLNQVLSHAILRICLLRFHKFIILILGTALITLNYHMVKVLRQIVSTTKPLKLETVCLVRLSVLKTIGYSNIELKCTRLSHHIRKKQMTLCVYWLNCNLVKWLNPLQCISLLVQQWL